MLIMPLMIIMLIMITMIVMIVIVRMIRTIRTIRMVRIIRIITIRIVMPSDACAYGNNILTSFVQSHPFRSVRPSCFGDNRLLTVNSTFVPGSVLPCKFPLWTEM